MYNPSDVAGLASLQGSVWEDQCPPFDSPLASNIFFSIFMFIVPVVLLNLVIAVILDALQSSTTDEQAFVSKSSVRRVRHPSQHVFACRSAALQ
jgi:hypothetical protein